MKGKIQNENDRQGLIELIQKLDLTKVFYWEVKKRVIRRSISQNALYWLWLSCIGDETGNDRNDLHEYFKGQLLVAKYIDVLGDSIMIKSTKGLTTAQFKEYLDKIQVQMSQEGITLPNPEDKIWDSFYEHYKDKL